MTRKITLPICLTLATLTLLAGCTSSDARDTSSSSSGDAGQTAQSDAGHTAQGDGSTPLVDASAAQVTATLGGTAFTIESGLGHVDGDGTIDLVLSSEEGACASTRAGKVHANETLVQLYGLKGSAPGAFTSDDIKFATVTPSCTSGTPLGDDEVSHAGRATKSAITITDVTAAHVAGLQVAAFGTLPPFDGWKVPFSARVVHSRRQSDGWQYGLSVELEG